MKKGINIVVFVVLAPILAFKGFLAYRDHDSYKDAVPQNVDWIIQIKVDQILRDIGLNAMMHPVYYLKRDSLEAEREDLERGFRLPANLFVFGLKEHPKAFFMKLSVTDSTDFGRFMRDGLQLASRERTDNFTLESTENGRLQLMYDQEKAVLGYFLGPPDIPLLETVFTNDNHLADKDGLLKKIKDSKSDISVLHEEHNLNLDLKNGALQLTGSLRPDPNWTIPEKTTYTLPDPESLAHFYLAARFKKPFLERDRINGIGIAWDSILPFYGDRLQGQLGKPVLQNDTIVTYAYNDDFEKTETKTVRKTKLPSVQLTVKGKAAPLNDYLHRAGIVADGHLNYKLFPLYRLETKQLNDRTLAFQNDRFDTSGCSSQSRNFARLEIDFEGIGAYPSLSSVRPLGSMSQFKITAEKQDSSIVLKGRLTLAEDDIHAGMQLLKDLNLRPKL